jgi:Cu2+-containing amine oxidase
LSPASALSSPRQIKLEIDRQCRIVSDIGAKQRFTALPRQIKMPSVEALPYPLDPLSQEEIEAAIATVKKAHGELFFNVVSMHEPRKAEMTAWLADPATAPRPARIADIVAIAPGGKVYDGLVDLKETKIIKWEHTEGVQPIVSNTDRDS